MNKFVLIEEDKHTDRRQNQDRRVEIAPTKFPIFTKEGAWIRRECRRMPERRIENINVTETEIKVEEFKELFKEYNK